MENISIEATKHLPKVVMNSETGHILLEGKAIVPNAVEFFEPLLKWTEVFSKNFPSKELTVDFKLEYFNTASSKMILQMLLVFRKIQLKGSVVNFSWHYFEDDDDMLDVAQEAELLSELKFNYKIME